MSENDKIKLRGTELVSRLMGIPTPVGGIDWDPPVGERDRAGQVLAHLAEQPVICDPYDMAIGSFVTQSILVTRERLGGELEGLADDCVLAEGIRAMRAACCMFLEENQSARSGYGSPYEAQLHSTLGALRALVGIHITRIACAYDLEVDAHLDGILPPEPD